MLFGNYGIIYIYIYVAQFESLCDSIQSQNKLCFPMLCPLVNFVQEHLGEDNQDFYHWAEITGQHTQTPLPWGSG